MISAKAYAAATARAPLAPVSIARRDPAADEVLIDIHYCGICHTDLHCARDEWGGQPFPCIPGHEVAGVVRAVGSAVTKYQVGDRVGVGCMVDSCGTCPACLAGIEQHCETGTVWTYGAQSAYRPGDPGTGHTLGGYTSAMTVKENFVVRIPDSLPLDRAAPMLCAGITTYSPLRRYGSGPGKRVGVIGLGGLGHMAVKIAHAMGAEVTVITTSPGKAADARALGADKVLVSTDQAHMREGAASLDVIIDTVSAEHDIDMYMQLLRLEGALVLVGLPPEKLKVSAFTLTGARRVFTGSNIGGIGETQEMLDFCATHGVMADIEMIPATGINAAYDRLSAGDVKYRFVIDSKTLG